MKQNNLPILSLSGNKVKKCTFAQKNIDMETDNVNQATHACLSVAVSHCD